MDKCRHHCRINSTGEGSDDFTSTYLLSDPGDTLVNEAAHCPNPTAPTNLADKIFQKYFALGGMGDLRMELKTIDTLVITHYGHRCVFRMGYGFETGRHYFNSITVAHPDRDRIIQPSKEGGFTVA